MRAVFAAALLLVAGCWSRDDFRSKCILAGNCQLDDVDAGFDAGLDPRRWKEVAALLFEVVPRRLEKRLERRVVGFGRHPIRHLLRLRRRRRRRAGAARGRGGVLRVRGRAGGRLLLRAC